jgi:hypothetical protein
MPLENLIARMEQRDTPDTPCNHGGVSRKPAYSGACTPETPDTRAIQKPLTATHCRLCGHPTPDEFTRMCPMCGTTHPFAATDEISMALTTAEWAIAQAALTDEKKAERLADLRRKPEIARFWAKLFDPTIAPSNSSSKENP